jgi:hypothetical protein
MRKPDLRETIFRYYVTLGYPPQRLRHILDYVMNHCIDDESMFQACKVLIDWHLPVSRRLTVLGLARSIAKSSLPIGVVCAVWLHAKYATPRELGTFMRVSVNVWRNNAFVARQVAAALPRLSERRADRRWAVDILRLSGQLDALRVVSNIKNLSESESLGIRDRGYLMPSSLTTRSSLCRVLIALAVLNGSLPSGEKRKIRDRMLTMISDPWYVRLISQTER